jgi:Tfp pilus assembly protein FimT
MSILIVIVSVVGAFAAGRLVQWISDARDAMSAGRRGSRRPR